jgi:hypothetical protein
MKWKHGILSLLGLTLLAAFPYGPLFAWSPVHPGYEKLRLTRADVLYPSGLTLDPACLEVDRYIAMAESFHQLKCSKRITVVVCRNWSDCIRFAPFLGEQRPLGVTMATGTVLYLTPNLKGSWDVGGVLRHELSHATLNQNRSLISVLHLLNQAWLSEGVAGVVAGMDAPASGRFLVTLSAPDFLARARNRDLWPSFDAIPQNDWRFSYTAWSFFWDREIELHGKSTFLKLESACMSEPEKCRSSFANVYGMELRTAVATYQDDLRSGRFVPYDGSSRKGSATNR